MKNDVIEVVFGDSLYAWMKKSKLGENEIILFNTLFSVSDLSTASEYRLSINMEISYFLVSVYSFKEEMNRLKTSVKNGDKIRVWSSHKDIEPYLLLLFLCNEFKDDIISLYVTFSEELDNCPTPSCLNERELEKLSGMEHKVSKDDMLKFSKEWESLVSENSQLRVMENDRVLSVNLDYFDDFILNILRSKGVSKISSICGEFMANYHIMDLQIVYFIDKLIEKGKVRIVEESDKRHFLDRIEVVI